MNNYYVGIDIGSTAAKVVVLDDHKIIEKIQIPTGWNSKETAQTIYNILSDKGITEHMICVATGYGRICVDYADKVVTEITCHGKGAYALYKQDCTIIDVGGQDTKIISVEQGRVTDFLMNDKCAAGTGKFIEIMASRLGLSLDELYTLAAIGQPVKISSMCTVFAESEIISHIGSGELREDIAAGIIDSVSERVSTLLTRFQRKHHIVLTGGLCDSLYFVDVLSDKIQTPVLTHSDARYAGALGAALLAAKRTYVE